MTYEQAKGLINKYGKDWGDHIKDIETPVKTEGLKKGDLFYTSWGYDQTNYDYLVVLEVSKTGKTAKCQMTKYLNMGTNGQSNVQEPIFCPFGDVFKMHVRTGYKGDLMLKGSYPYCNGDMKNTRLDSFCRHKEGKQYYETMPQFGH